MVEVELCPTCFHPYGPDPELYCQFIGHGMLKMAWRKDKDDNYTPV